MFAKLHGQNLPMFLQAEAVHLCEVAGVVYKHYCTEGIPLLPQHPLKTHIKKSWVLFNVSS